MDSDVWTLLYNGEQYVTKITGRLSVEECQQRQAQGWIKIYESDTDFIMWWMPKSQIPAVSIFTPRTDEDRRQTMESAGWTLKWVDYTDPQQECWERK